ncbi:MAG: hypothetical protein DI535_16580 [Citrobacter freundii]|nr:MAG: hypothetical protein DI535_16580 [Citrobacter freundii]
MKSLPLLLTFHLLLTLPSFAQPASSLRPILDSSLAKMEQYSLHRQQINWKEFRDRAYRLTEGLDNPDSLYQKFTTLFEWLDDDHGGLQTAAVYISWQKRNNRENGRYAFFDSVAGKVAPLKAARWEDLAYLRVPGGTTKSVPKVIKLITDSLCTITPSTATGWVLDLRLNRGGNVWFNLASLATLIGDGPAGGIRFLDDRPEQTIRIEQGRAFGNGQWYGADSAICPLFSSRTPVVVLTGPLTASSAETLLLAFKGRPHTLIIGEPTGGFTTNNNSFPLTDKLTLVLATGYMTDRQGKVYASSIAPDIMITGGDNFADLQQDAKVAAAIEWLKKQMD